MAGEPSQRRLRSIWRPEAASPQPAHELSVSSWRIYNPLPQLCRVTIDFSCRGDLTVGLPLLKDASRKRLKVLQPLKQQ